MAKKAPEVVNEDIFLWEGVDKRGDKLKGELVGKTISLVKAELRRQGITPEKVRKKPKPLFGGSKKKIKSHDIAVFSRQMSAMINAGVPLVQAVDIVGQGHDNPSMRDLLIRIKTDVSGGSTLANAMSKHPEYFDELYCNLVEAGERAGVLDTMMERISVYKEKTESMKAKIKKAMFYPIAVLSVAFIVTLILLIFVVPQFKDLFEGFGGELPAFTQLVVSMSEAVQEIWYLIAIGVFGAITGLKAAIKGSKSFARSVERFKMGIPNLGPIFRKAAIARFARTLSTMFAAGVPLLEALESVAGATGNLIYYDAVMRIREDVAVGQRLQLAMYKTQLFPPLVTQMVGIGEEAGALDEMLSKVADFFEEEVDNAVDGISALMEPFIMVFLAVILGGLVLAMYLPIFNMGDVM
ncbi:MAG: type II secretion system F family protein [Gammaproteobacteria bacterium]|nr:type II secretion system F family protein [Gammaproteobacteria bacterium]MCP5137759.1 type II secretion system F family protein [Gammaproteobacteria bacterium]